MHVLRVYHGGRSQAHRVRERALAAAGVDVTLAVPSGWEVDGGEEVLSPEAFPVVELPVRRSGDVNRHAYTDPAVLARLVRDVAPELLDVHEEPFSVAARQWLAVAPAALPVVMYTAQNVDKRYPPPFAQYERHAHRRVAALYPCSTQAASVARGKGFDGLIEVLPLGYDDGVFFPGGQSLDDEELVLGLIGRLVPEKGVADAIEVLGRVNKIRPTRLVLVGSGPEEKRARSRAAAHGLAARVEMAPWQTPARLAEMYRRMHFVLVPSRATTTWVEQFGRVIVEAQASGAVVAGYRSGSIPEVVGEAGVLQTSGAERELAHRISSLLTDPSEYFLRRKLGFELSRERTWTRVAEHQARLYQRVVNGEARRLRLPPSPRRRRAFARREFGPPASTIAGERPFALPVLRRGGIVASALAACIDVCVELIARARMRSAKARGCPCDQ